MGQTQGIFDDISDWFRQKRFGFTVQGLPDDKFMVVEMQGSETMSRPYSFRLSLVSQDSRINFDSVMEKSATLSIQRERRRDPDYKYYGIVTSFEQEGKAGRYTYYSATIEPRLTLLWRYRYSEVYVNQSVKQVIVKVLTDCGLFEGTDFEVRLKESPAIDFICQYEESCLDFISRLMEREGIYYYFDNGEGRERMVIVDALIGHTPGSGDLTYRQAAEMETEPGVDSMQSLVCRQRTLPKTLKLRNYYYDSAQPQVYAEATISAKGIGSIEIFGEDIRNSDEASKLAKIRAEEISCREKIFEGESSAVGIRPGLFFTLSRHYRPDFCLKYLPLAVVHEGSQSVAGLSGLDRDLQGSDKKSSYQNKITSIVGDVQFRPERITRKPVVIGSMSGFVDGPEGVREYADLDDKGRYKIWFPFRRNQPTSEQLQHQSGYVRFATPNAGPESGLHFPLRKDSEVILSFNGGNPDLPIITGAAANAKFPNMVTSKNYTRNVWKTHGDNLLEMADNDQHQLIRLRTPNKNTVISMGENTGVLDNLGGLNGSQQGAGSNGTGSGGSGSGSSTSSTRTTSDGPSPENLQLYTQGNTLLKSDGYTRVEAGSTRTTDHDQTKTPQAGDLMTAVSRNSASWVGVDETHRVMNHTVYEVGAAPPQLSAGDESFRIAAAGDIKFQTAKTYDLKCHEKKEKIGEGSWLDIGKATTMTHGERIDIFAGQALTVNLGSLERLFVGIRVSMFVAPKVDFHLVSKWDLTVGKFESNLLMAMKAEAGIGYNYGSIKIKNEGISIKTRVTDLENDVSKLVNIAANLTNTSANILNGLMTLMT
jgi:type VI secretion system VgrG family protein